MISMMTNFRVKRMPSIENLPLLTGLDRRPMAPSNVPAGQMYLQNPGTGMPCATPYHSGTATANTPRMMYLR